MPRDVASEAVTAAVKGDDELGTAARRLAVQAIVTAQQFLTYGSPAVQLKIVTTLLPAVGRALAGQSEDEELAEVRAQLRGLQQAMLDAS